MILSTWRSLCPQLACIPAMQGLGMRVIPVIPVPKTAPTSTDLLKKKSKCACTIVMHFLNISSKQVAWNPTPGPEKLGDKMANRRTGELEILKLVHPQRSSNPLLKPAVLCCRKPPGGSSWQSSWFANSSFLVVACSTGGSRWAGARPCWVLSTHPKNPLFHWGDWKSSQIISDSYVKIPKTNVRLATRIIS